MEPLLKSTVFLGGNRTHVRSGLLSESEYSVFGQQSASDNNPFGGLLSEFVSQLLIALSIGIRVSDNSPFGGLLSEYSSTCACEHITRIIEGT